MALKMATHRVLALIHRDRDDEKLTRSPNFLCAASILGSSSAQIGHHGAELHDDGLLAIHRDSATESPFRILNRDCRRTLTDRNTNDSCPWSIAVPEAVVPRTAPLPYLASLHEIVLSHEQ